MTEPMYERVDPKVSFPELETRIMARWKEERIFERSLEQRADAPEWVFYEGPPTANARPGIHHVEARAFKDLFCRFQTMRGHYVHRKAGWDCHGLPVEIEVEKQLGITEKREIEEKYGIEEFVRLCRESVQRYADDWERLTDRIAFWLDLDAAYWTMSRDYIESVWWILKKIWDDGLLQEDFKVVPYCPRCETALSSHEQHQTGAYRNVVDPSIYVRFPLADRPDVALLVWTTTPWTLLSNVAAAVGPDIAYVRVADPALEAHSLWLAEARVEALLGEDAEVLERAAGRDLVGSRYVPPFPFLPTGEREHRVGPGAFVTTEDGTGIVHLAPYGEEDMEFIRTHDLDFVGMIDASGRVREQAEELAGLPVKEADPRIIADLARRDLLFRAEDYEHAYPHCWRCHTPLLYYPRMDWYIRTSRLRDQMQAANETINWQPPTIKYGRFGDWLANNVDWSLSRDRYWGTPLPIWRCEERHDVCIGSFAELSDRTGRDLSALDPHRPYVDEITFPCPTCGKEARRVGYVIDTWFDSGSMPFAQWHHPFENRDLFERRFPADFISEAIDQTRGWFYSLLAVATLVEGSTSYRNVVCLGHIVDAEGRKMSKSLGNVIDPWKVLDVQGADALRWYILTGGTPWASRRLSVEIVEESLRKHLLTLWNTYSFWVTYASLESFDPSAEDVPPSERHEMDRWILAELSDTVSVVTDALEDFDAGRAGKRLDKLVDDLSNWYVRRSRRRFWRSPTESDTRAAFLTLWECLVTVARLSAPFTPFVADEIYTNLTRPLDAPSSVHLADWPDADPATRDDPLRARMALARRLVALGRAARTDAKVRVRQPLRRALVVAPPGEAAEIGGLEEVIAEELNVRSVEVARGLGDLISYSVKPNFRALGPRFGSKVKEVARALASADAEAVVRAVEQEGRFELDLDDAKVGLGSDDLDIRIEGREGFALVREGAYGVALDLDIDADLRAEGMAREVVRSIQDLRKSSGLAVEDRIELWLDWDSVAIGEALERHRQWISSEVLAVDVRLGQEPVGDTTTDRVELDAGHAVIGLRRAPS